MYSFLQALFPTHMRKISANMLIRRLSSLSQSSIQEDVASLVTANSFLVAEKAKKIQELMERIHVGDTAEGAVKNVTDFGCIHRSGRR